MSRHNQRLQSVRHRLQRTRLGQRGEHAQGLGFAALLALVFVQLALGAWVSSNYAVLACADFPTCQGQWWPQDMAWQAGFELWRPLGMNAQGQPIAASALVAVHLAHRLAALGVVLGLAWLAWSQWRRWPSGAKGLAILTLAQVTSGVSNVVLQWPLAAALAHTAGAAALVLVLTAGLVGAIQDGGAHA